MWLSAHTLSWHFWCFSSYSPYQKSHYLQFLTLSLFISGHICSSLHVSVRRATADTGQERREESNGGQGSQERRAHSERSGWQCLCSTMPSRCSFSWVVFPLFIQGWQSSHEALIGGGGEELLLTTSRLLLLLLLLTPEVNMLHHIVQQALKHEAAGGWVVGSDKPEGQAGEKSRGTTWLAGAKETASIIYSHANAT